jgi:hypothetical protein
MAVFAPEAGRVSVRARTCSSDIQPDSILDED